MPPRDTSAVETHRTAGDTEGKRSPWSDIRKCQM